MHIDPSRAQFEAFKELPRDQPVTMLNLVLLQREVRLPDGTIISGADSYAAYGEKSQPVFEKVGGAIIWRGVPQPPLIGPGATRWDIAFLARYPTLGAFLAMVTDPDYQAIVHHRQLAVADSRLVPMFDAENGSGFG